MKNKSKFIILALIVLMSVIGVSYAFFVYYRISENSNKLIFGDIYLKLNEGTDTITLLNVFPETVEKARSRTDNQITFTVSGINTTTNKDIWYEIMLNEGNEVEGRTRFNPEDLVFDLIEVDENGNDIYVVDAQSYSDIDARRIWVNTVDRNTTTEINKTYKLRMWLSEDVFISDTNPNATYSVGVYETSYASVKVSVYGDFVEKTLQNYLARGETSFWPTEIDNQKENITEVSFVSLAQTEIDTRYNAANIKADISEVQNGSIKTWLEADTVDNTKYTMYVASDVTMCFPSDCSNMFDGFTSVTNFDFENIDVSKVTSMLNMFSKCSSLISLDLSGFIASNVSITTGMFANCTNLLYLDISGLILVDILQGGQYSGGMFFSMLDTASLTVADAEQKNWILTLSSPHRPDAWTTDNILVKN